VRFVRGDPGSFQTYAGAGVNRAQYFGATVERSPAWLGPGNIYGDVGAAAEAGAELRVSERLLFTANLRWADLDDDVGALRGQNGPIAADPLVLAFSVGYRFR
jgi:outer membrane protein